ncbi:hypothetical protein COCNU_14G009090 [Cocos nucifera]|uniref:Uncharacterized protein n=1 Tax=Cocos nucifera TaxID=13894 RepID=A0A8K0NC35_COCNU|nr:hypothetical protein COCNU_14G009090 [Cocos nucifera]
MKALDKRVDLIENDLDRGKREECGVTAPATSAVSSDFGIAKKINGKEEDKQPMDKKGGRAVDEWSLPKKPVKCTSVLESHVDVSKSHTVSKYFTLEDMNIEDSQEQQNMEISDIVVFSAMSNDARTIKGKRKRSPTRQQIHSNSILHRKLECCYSSL